MFNESWGAWISLIYITFPMIFLIFIYFCLHWGLHCWARAFSSCVELGLLFVVVTGFSLWWLLLLQRMGSRCERFSSCGTRASWLCGMEDLPRPGIQPLSPALAGGLLTTEPPGKSMIIFNSISLLSPNFFSLMIKCMAILSSSLKRYIMIYKNIWLMNAFYQRLGFSNFFYSLYHLFFPFKICRHYKAIRFHSKTGDAIDKVHMVFWWGLLKLG